MTIESTPHGRTPVLEKTTDYTYRGRTIPLHRINPDTLHRIWNRSPVDSLAHRDSQVPFETLLSRQALTPAPVPVELDQTRIDSEYPVVTPDGNYVLTDGGDNSAQRAKLTFAIPGRRPRVGTFASLLAGSLLLVGSVAGSVQKNQPPGTTDLAGQTIPENKGFSGHAREVDPQGVIYPDTDPMCDKCGKNHTGGCTINSCEVTGSQSSSSGSGITTETYSNGQVSPECPSPGSYTYMDAHGIMHTCGKDQASSYNNPASTPQPSPIPNTPTPQPTVTSQEQSGRPQQAKTTSNDLGSVVPLLGVGGIIAAAVGAIAARGMGKREQLKIKAAQEAQEAKHKEQHDRYKAAVLDNNRRADEALQLVESNSIEQWCALVARALYGDPTAAAAIRSPNAVDIRMSLGAIYEQMKRGGYPIVKGMSLREFERAAQDGTKQGKIYLKDSRGKLTEVIQQEARHTTLAPVKEKRKGIIDRLKTF